MTDTKVSVFGAKAAMLNPEALKSAMMQSATIGGRQDSAFCNFSGKRGVYEIGVDKRDADKDEVWLVNVASFEDGYICWKGGAPQATRLYPIGAPIPPLDRTEHGPFTKDGDGWYDAKAMVIKSLDNDEQCYFKINSVSGVSAFADLQREITGRMVAGTSYWPIVNLHKEQFTAKGFKNSKPVLHIVGWLSDEAVELLADENDETSLADLLAMSNDGPAPVAQKAVASGRRKL
jgi:hypothetical protein